MKTVNLTVSQALVKFLNVQYLNVDESEIKFVKGFAGIFGHGNVVGLGQALHQYRDEISYIQGKNEQEIAHVCTAFAKQNNRQQIIACTSSIGPGALNMVTAAGTATVNKIPLLLFPADTYADRQPDPVLQQMENAQDYTVSVNDSFKAVSKYWDRITRPEQLMSALLNAMRVLTDPAETGAVTICLPQDVQGYSYDYPVAFFEKRVWFMDRLYPSPNATKRASNLLATKKKPIIICGGGVKYSNASKEVLAFAEKFNIPICETQAGKGEIPFDHKLNLGCVGVCGTLCANLILRDADVVIAIGTKLNDFVTGSKEFFSKESLNIISINVNKMDSLKMDSCSMVADAKIGIQQLGTFLLDKNYKSSYTNEIADTKQLWKEELNRLTTADDSIGLSQAKVLITLNNTLEDTDIIVSASGSMPSDLERIWYVKKPNTYHLEYGFSCMGYEVSGALGAKLATPDAEVYALIGDGVFMMGHSDLVTSLQEQKKINIILFDNNGHQCIHNLQRAQGIGSFGTEFRYRQEDNALSGNYLNIDFAKIAEGYGAKSYKVNTMEQLKEAIADSKKQTISTLIEIKVLPGTMTDGYEAFWRVGLATVSNSDTVNECAKALSEKVKEIRKY